MAEPLAAARFLAKAELSLAAAEAALDKAHYDTCANRCYYACFQAAVAALLREGIRPAEEDRWGHGFVHSQFSGQLIHRRKRYPGELRSVLKDSYDLRRVADYGEDSVSQREASRALRRARAFVHSIREGGTRG